MKLRNKKTGHIIECSVICSDENLLTRLIESNEGGPITLAELNEEWEDALEEPNEYYCIDWTEPDGIYKTKREDIRDDFNKEIGNYFNTREEAEKAVEKLKAWKRLKDKGFNAYSSSICGDDFVANFKLNDKEDYSQSMDDFDCILDLGGEE